MVQVFSYGDHGLTSILVYQGFLWVTYMVQDPRWGCCGCTDYGQMNGRPNAEVRRPRLVCPASRQQRSAAAGAGCLLHDPKTPRHLLPRSHAPSSLPRLLVGGGCR
jgi:hypothetical protein